MLDPRFNELLFKMEKIQERKSADYGGENPIGNFMEAEKLGVEPFVGVLVRMSDKWSRLCRFARSKSLKVKDEKITDTLLDLAVYSLLAIIVFEEKEEGRW